jgi:hypothetical protein
MQRRHFVGVVIGGITTGCSEFVSTGTQTPQSTGGTPTVSTTAPSDDTQTRTSAASLTQPPTSTASPSENDVYGGVGYGESGYGGVQ